MASKNREENWNIAFQQTQKVVDGLNKEIDSSILELITALNLSDIRTTSSCEGHFDINLFPYVSIEKVSEEKAYKVLCEFYENKKINFSTFIHISDAKGTKRLINNLNYKTAENDLNKHFNECQEEFIELGKFLKTQYLNT